MGNELDVTIVGGGMITGDLILPVMYHLQRVGVIGNINICALTSDSLKSLTEKKEIVTAFKGHSFTPFPSLSESPEKKFQNLYKEIIAKMGSRQVVIVAVPDDLHYEVIMHALNCNQHVLCVKPLVLKYSQAEEIAKVAYDKGLFVGVEYHKRFDRRNLIAKRNYEQGLFGEFMLGEAKMIEPYYYRKSNFQNWFTTQKTDSFVYVGCHYVDLVYFITGLKPVEVTVSGVKRNFPNGNEGYLWVNGRIKFDNGALLSVSNGLGYPNHAAGANAQSLIMYCEGKDSSGLIEHIDDYRGTTYCNIKGNGEENPLFHYVNPDFNRLILWEGPELKPVGYGFDSIAAIINVIDRIEKDVQLIPEDKALLRRQVIIKEVDKKGIIATPANSYINELVNEAARVSILNDGKFVKIVYGKNPHIEPL
jgi:predicted dehydrogenase